MSSKNSQVPESVKFACQTVRTEFTRIRHIGYYDSFGKVLYDTSREQLEPLKGEGLEEMHILNGTAATTLDIWKRSATLLGRMDFLVMALEKVVDLLVPHDGGSYFLIVFDSGVPLGDVEAVRKSIGRALARGD